MHVNKSRHDVLSGKIYFRITRKIRTIRDKAGDFFSIREKDKASLYLRFFGAV